MPTKSITHKSINVRIATYDQIVEIAEQLSKDKGVPVGIPTTVQLLVDAWGQKGANR